MKVAITSTGTNPDAKLDSRFGRCSCFVIYDTLNCSTEYILNPNIENVEGAGPASVQLIASKGVTKVVSGEFGIKVRAIFDQLKIELVVLQESEKKISEIITLLHA
jgi:predicted Fe-Mo cluster-binding NifX family protein